MFTTRRLHQDAVYFAVGTERTSTAQRKVYAGIPIKVRWTEGQQEALDEHGSPIRLDARVVVDRSIAIGSILWLGKLTDFDSDNTSDLFEVTTIKETKNLRANQTRRVLGLQRYSDTLPPIQT
jgi:hypothetical protein